MRSFFTRRVIAVIFIATALGVGLFAYVFSRNDRSSEPLSAEPVTVKNLGPEREVIGLSVERREIEAFTYLPRQLASIQQSEQAGRDGETRLMFVGGIHGGYEWNSVLLAYQFMDYLDANPEVIPANLAVTVIPSANPDGVYKVIGKEGRFTAGDVPKNVPTAPGRLNARAVDLNRNFDCKWKPEGVWKGSPVSAGTAPFSEPESVAIRDFVIENEPSAVIFWHSQANAVYASECKAGILPRTLDIMNAYSRASGYPAVRSFDAYEVTGDSEGWLASIGIPAITVELQTHETVEWERNLAGIKAILEYYRR